LTVFNFTQEQQTAINTTEGIVCLSAGPGCGKTFVLVNRYIAILKKLIASGVLAEEAFGKILAVTFTRKAAHEMKERIVKELKEFDAQKIKHNIRISTIDGWASSFLKEFSENPDFELVDNTFAKAKFLEIAQKLFDSYDVKDMELPKRPKDLFVDIFYFLGKLKSQLITPQQFPENSKLAKFIKEVAEIFDAWMLENNYLVYADLLFYTHQVFQNQPEILKEYAEAIEYILIDEYQDLNDAQDQVLRMISRENYFLVGDIGQSIYGFRAANYRNMLDYRNFKAESIL
jgi:DNA helicase-2/ATP-dependent DNA helicase PcrA